jgi:hypothetical protein
MPVSCGAHRATVQPQMCMLAWRPQRSFPPSWPRLLQRGVDTLPCWQERYEKPRKAANTAMMAAMDTLRLLFSADAPVLAGARSLGLGALQSLPPVKNRIMQYAMGL